MENETIKEIGLRISKLRIEKKMSQKELGSEIGVSRDIINFYETGKRVPKTETLIYLSNFFNVSTDYLLCITNNPTIKESKNKSIVSDICDYTGLSISSINKLHSYIEEDIAIQQRKKSIEAFNRNICRQDSDGPNTGEIIDIFFKQHPFCLLAINKLIENDIFEKLSSILIKYIDYNFYSHLQTHLREECIKDLQKKEESLTDDEIEKLTEEYNNECLHTTGARLFSNKEYNDKEYCDYLEYCISKEFINFLKNLNISEYEYKNEMLSWR